MGPRAEDCIKRMIKYMKHDLMLESVEFRVPRLDAASHASWSTAQHLDELAQELEVELEDDECWDFAKCTTEKVMGARSDRTF